MTSYDQPQGGVPATQSTGAFSWWSYFFSFVPFVGGLAYIIIVIVLFLQSRERGELARGNARNALNWMLTFVLGGIVISVIAIIIVFATASTTTTSTGVSADSTSPLLFIPWLLGAIWGIVAIVFAIMGGLAAGRGQVYRAPAAVNFIKG